MTENESIENILYMGVGRSGLENEPHEIAQALSELMEYRAIGTVEGYERAIQSSIENYNLYREYKAKVQEFEAIGTIEEFNALKEKNEPKEIHRLPMDDTCIYYENHCPNCDSLLVVRYKCCPKCGQKLDWQ